MSAHRRRFLFSLLLAALLLVLIVVALLALLPSLHVPLVQTGLSAPPSQNGTFEVHFCPVEDCAAILIAQVDAATDVRCAFYDLDLEPLVDALERKGADVLVFDENNPAYGTPVANRRSGLMHDKFCILDGETVISGSANPTKGLLTNDNNIVIVRGAYLAENYRAEFDELKAGTERPVLYPAVLHTDPTNATFLVESYFCPEDRCAERVLAALRAANRSIRFLTFSFTDDRIGDLLVEKNASGVAVTGVFEKSQESKYSEYTGLKAAGLDVALDANKALMHHKVFILDAGTPQAIVITGSYNPTSNGDTRNDENVLIIHDERIAAQYLVEFERIFGLSSS